jgi:hypothetical protein
MRSLTVICILVLLNLKVFAQVETRETGAFWKPDPSNYEVKQAVETESLFPMFFFGGWHIGIGYRYNNFRVRFSVINGGEYNADVQSVKGEIDGYKRYYTTSPGIFIGYNFWKNLELYGYYEKHKFDVIQLSSNETKEISSNDAGIGISFQFFIGRIFYIQPGIHIYFRAERSVTYSDNQTYSIPKVELTPIIRIGARFWKKY